MTDQELQRLLRDSVPPPALSTDDDATLEARLDAQESDPAYGMEMLARARRTPRTDTNKLLLVAALLVLTTIPIVIIAIASSGVNTAGTNQDPDFIEFRPNFPDPMFFGTPLEIELPNLEPAHPPRLTFTAPATVKLVSRGKPTTSSASNLLLGNLTMVTDGIKTGDDDHFIELPPGRQWIQIDLEESREIFAITLWHYHKMMRAYRDVVIRASEDPGFSSGVHTIFNNDHDDSLGFGAGQDLAYIETNHGRIIDVDGLHARYIRLHSNGNTNDDLNHYTEVEIYGR